ncbi:MAG: dipeptide epimerase, partial [Xanthomonadales bacterium]|nr:dipeptide epimerase [Xanthomonadales bacterium]
AAGHGEGTGIYYFAETGESMLAQAESVRRELERGADRQALRKLLPAGGARNAIDCALWDLEAKLSGKSIWELTGITPTKVVTFETVGIGSLDEMADSARRLDSPRIKIKLDGDDPLERVRAVREARPDALIVVDVNQGWTYKQLQEMAPRLRDLGVAMIEQPLPRGGDEELEGFRSPVPLCADESCIDTTEFPQAARRYRMINIKLDKTGGLTEALDLADLAQEHGLELMVGNMMGTSLAMAPGYVVAQLCTYADLDGALYLTRDREHAMRYEHGVVTPPTPALWG